WAGDAIGAKARNQRRRHSSHLPPDHRTLPGGDGGVLNGIGFVERRWHLARVVDQSLGCASGGKKRARNQRRVITRQFHSPSHSMAFLLWVKETGVIGNPQERV